MPSHFFIGDVPLVSTSFEIYQLRLLWCAQRAADEDEPGEAPNDNHSSSSVNGTPSARASFPSVGRAVNAAHSIAALVLADADVEVYMDDPAAQTGDLVPRDRAVATRFWRGSSRWPSGVGRVVDDHRPDM